MSGTGAVVRMLRKARGLTQCELSKRSGVSQSSVCKHEKGAPIKPTALRRYAKAFGMTVDDLTRLHAESAGCTDVHYMAEALAAMLSIPVESGRRDAAIRWLTARLATETHREDGPSA